MYTKILAAVNEHLNSEISARYALNVARTCGAKLFLCFIAEKDLSKSSFDKAEDAMKRLFIEAEKGDIDVESVTETGNPVREIEKIARHEKINIVFASTRREDVEKRFYAGTVENLLQRTHIADFCLAHRYRSSLFTSGPGCVSLLLLNSLSHHLTLQQSSSELRTGCVGYGAIPTPLAPFSPTCGARCAPHNHSTEKNALG